jgi:hypothetical protein
MDTHQEPLINTLIAQNATLSGRVSQLESENSSLRIQHAGFERYFGEHRRDLYRRHRSALYGILGEELSSSMGDILNRREAFLRLISEIPGCNSLLDLHPHNGMGNRYRVLMLSAGGMGDCLILTYLAALVRTYLPVDYLAVGFESNQIKEIFADTGLADVELALNHETRDSLFSVATAIDVFDIVIDVRYSAVAFFPPKSRVPLEYQLTVRSFSEPWFKYNIFDWPHLNHHFAKAAVEAKFTAYSLFPNSLALGDVKMKPVMDIEPIHSASIEELLSSKKTIVCLGIGSDAKMAGDNGLSTKTVPMETIDSTTATLNNLGYLTVQLGMAHEPLIKGVCIDLRGKLTVRESAAVLKIAVCFLGVEGGLVHMAKAVGTPSVVCFGPTPARFFGYEENINISREGCTPCWWTTREWMTKCISSSKQRGCMTAITPSDLVEGVQTLHRRNSRPLEIVMTAEHQLDIGKIKSSEIPMLNSIYSDVNDQIVSNDILSSYLVKDKKSDLLKLNRNNIPHILSIKTSIFIDSSNLSKLALQITNVDNLIDTDGSGVIIVGDFKEEEICPLKHIAAEAAFQNIVNTFVAKGQTINTTKPKKISAGSGYYITIRWAAQ